MKKGMIELPESRYLELIAAEKELAAVRGEKPMGFSKPAPTKVESIRAEVSVPDDLRQKVVSVISKDIERFQKSRSDKTIKAPYGGGKYWFNGIAARNVGFAGVSAGKLDPNGMKPATVLAIAKDYGIK